MLAPNRRNLGELLTGEWPYWVGGLMLAAVNTSVLAILGRPWGITGPITNLGGRMLEHLGLRPETWDYFRAADHEQGFQEFDWLNGLLWLNLGVMAGALAASWLSGEFRLRSGPRTWRAAGLALTGGLLMGYGTRLSAGCNAGALLGGIPSLGLHGWVFAAAAFAGVLLGILLFRRSFGGGSPP